MAQKAPIILYQEAQGMLVNTINYYIQQGVPVYELKAIVDNIQSDLSKVVEQETTKAKTEYDEAVAKEKEQETKSEKAE